MNENDALYFLTGLAILFAGSCVFSLIGMWSMKREEQADKKRIERRKAGDWSPFESEADCKDFWDCVNGTNY